MHRSVIVHFWTDPWRLCSFRRRINHHEVISEVSSFRRRIGICAMRGLVVRVVGDHRADLTHHRADAFGRDFPQNPIDEEGIARQPMLAFM